MIHPLESIVFDLLSLYQSNNKILPRRLVYLRDGLSEGHFKIVLQWEMNAIRRACLKVGGEIYKPGVSFVVVQKRHTTKLFPVNEKNLVGRILMYNGG